jgi:hypothetical protein
VWESIGSIGIIMSVEQYRKLDVWGLWKCENVERSMKTRNGRKGWFVNQNGCRETDNHPVFKHWF